MTKFFVALGVLAIGVLAMAQEVRPYDPTPETPKDSISKFSLGLGAGVMYGQLGTNIEYRLTPMFTATGGVGLNGDGNWFVGGRYYLRPEGSGSRPRLTVGVGSYADTAFFDDGRPTSNRAYFAVGATWANRENDFRGFDIDITTNGEFSVGYHF